MRRPPCRVRARTTGIPQTNNNKKLWDPLNSTIAESLWPARRADSAIGSPTSGLPTPVRCGKCRDVDRRAEHADRGRLRRRIRPACRSASSLPVVVDCWAPWCGPCRMVAPEVQKVAARQAGRALVVKVNTDQLSDLGARFNIRSIPTLAVFAGGREVSRASGARPAEEIEAFIRQATAAVPQ